jgi:hypothetical protein
MTAARCSLLMLLVVAVTRLAVGAQERLFWFTDRSLAELGTTPATARAERERRCLLLDRAPRGRLGTRGLSQCVHHSVDSTRIRAPFSNLRPIAQQSSLLPCTIGSWFQVKAPGEPNVRGRGPGNAVTLSWDDPGNTTHFDLEVGSSSGLRNLLVMSLNGTSFTASGVPPGTYYLRLRAISEVGRSLPSQEITLVVPGARGTLHDFDGLCAETSRLHAVSTPGRGGYKGAAERLQRRSDAR